MPTSIIIGIIAVAATSIGGLFAVRIKDKLHLVLGFSAGAVIAVAFFEIIPEAIKLAGNKYESATIAAAMGTAFLAYLILDRVILASGHANADSEEKHTSQKRGTLGASTLSVHSFLDGVAVGVAFQASTAVGLIVSTAVLAHDFSDGINTANLVLKSGGTVRRAIGWIVADALAPLAGVLSTLLFTLPQETLGLILALFAGDFLYIGASELLPESYHRHPKAFTTAMTVLGMALIFIIVRFADR